jgi:mono/diheme cytochrome c family protein
MRINSLFTSLPLAAAIFRSSLCLAAIAWLALASSAGADEPNDEFFEKNVRPILAGTCQKCHGTKKQWASLRLDSREAMLKGGDTGPAVVPGKPDESLLIAAVRHAGDVEMPPSGKLNDQQIAALSRWVELGAPWPHDPAAPSAAPIDASNHWAFQPVADPPVPASKGERKYPIDAFIDHELSDAKLTPADAADRRTLIRRATIDLTGMPSTADEVEAFVADDDPRAYEKLIDRLLASPHYGEQWGRHWLDVVRYADSKGYVYAHQERFFSHAWPYRDWVVKSLNDDMPYDRFLLLQIAADQVAPDDPPSQAAMGMLTLGRQFLNVRNDVIDDQIDVITRGTMALTVTCARCHDHKYDPIPTRDYYSLYGVLNNCYERRVQINEPPVDEEYEKFLAEWNKRQTKFDAAVNEMKRVAVEHARDRVRDYLSLYVSRKPFYRDGYDMKYSGNGLRPGFVRQWNGYLDLSKQNRDPIWTAWLAYAELTRDKFKGGRQSVYERLAAMPPDNANPRVVAHFAAAPISMYEVADRYADLLTEINKKWLAKLKEAEEKKEPAPVALDDPQEEAIRQVLYGADSPCVTPDASMAELNDFFIVLDGEKVWKLQREVDHLLVESPAAPKFAVVMRDRKYPVEVNVLKRGNPTTPGEHAPRQFLEAIAGEDRRPFERGSGRLELAESIVDPKNPLTARVIVNRVWQGHFGEGLVRTTSNFGVRGDSPTHPELLDWLAKRLVEEGWRLKPLHRRIMLSEAYCRSSFGPSDPKALAKCEKRDPENRLLWRMNVHRLAFEEMRDSMLCAAGSIDQTVGGRPAELFDGSFRRRTIYGTVDRQYLPNLWRVFDFANPDLHVGQRADTTVPQQALFFMNHPFVVEQAKKLAERTASAEKKDRVEQMFRFAYQRPPTDEQSAAALAFVEEASDSDAANDSGEKIDPKIQLDPWQQLAQALLSSNEFMYVD